MNYFKKELNEIPENYLTSEQRVKRKTLIKLCKYASNYKLKDAQNLKKIFDIYRYPRVLFDLDKD